MPHAVKIDVEGFEYAVLRGLCGTLASPTCRLICIEIHPEALPSGVGAETITELLRSLGFGQFKTERRDTELHVVAVKPAHIP
jgi:Methyltransferase FkbM domain